MPQAVPELLPLPLELQICWKSPHGGSQQLPHRWHHGGKEGSRPFASQYHQQGASLQPQGGSSAPHTLQPQAFLWLHTFRHLAGAAFCTLAHNKTESATPAVIARRSQRPQHTPRDLESFCPWSEHAPSCSE